MNAGTGMAIQNQLTFSREFEREADNIGTQILSRAGFGRPRHADVFERMQRVNRVNDNQALAFLRTHPVTGERISAGQDHAASCQSSWWPTAQRFAGAGKCRVLQLGPMEAVKFYQHALAQRQFNNEAAIWYGLAVAKLKLGRRQRRAERLERGQPAHGPAADVAELCWRHPSASARLPWCTGAVPRCCPPLPGCALSGLWRGGRRPGTDDAAGWLRCSNPCRCASPATRSSGSGGAPVCGS